jgi:hypothetical protein
MGRETFCLFSYFEFDDVCRDTFTAAVSNYG